MNDVDPNSNGRLAHLLDRQKQLDALVATEKIRLAKKRDRVNAKLFMALGQAVSKAAEQSPQFHLMIRQTLDGLGISDPATRRVLTTRGFLS
jgi:hypothetical protein